MQRKSGGITRRSFLHGSSLAAAGILAAPDLNAWVAPKNAAKPNILFIITDDQKTEEFGFIGGKALTPNIDRLARRGVYCSRAYATSSVCTPSRYTCMTGRYASRSQDSRVKKGTSKEGQKWIHWNADLAPSETNVAKALKAAGYATGIVGKLHGFSLPKQSDKTGPETDPNAPGVKAILEERQRAYAEALVEFGFDYAAAMNRANLASSKTLPAALRQHSPEWKAEAARSFIEENKDRPWYLYYATTLTHGPSPLESLASDPRITEAGILDRPPQAQPSRQSVFDRCKKAGVPRSLAPATWLDDNIGALLEKLEETGQADNTLIVYFNDHGVDGGKGTLYEGGVHTPTIVTWAGVLPPGRSDALIANIDFVPTILAAAGAEPLAGMRIDGMDLLPHLKNHSVPTREALCCEIGHTRAVVTKRWKYIAFRVPPSLELPKEERIRNLEEYHKKNPRRKEQSYDPEARVTHIHRVPGGDGTERENGLLRYRKNYFDRDQLYDLEADPREKTNLAGDPRYRDVLIAMRTNLKKLLVPLPGTFDL